MPSFMKNDLKGTLLDIESDQSIQMSANAHEISYHTLKK